MGVELGNGECVPVKYKAAHLYSSFAKSIATIDKNTGLRGVEIPENITGLLEDLQKALVANRMGNGNEEIKINVQKLIKADEYLQSNGAVAAQYMQALWEFHLNDAVPNDDAASNAVAELSSDDGSDDESEGDDAEGDDAEGDDAEGDEE